MGPKTPIPALLTRISMGPSDCSVFCTSDAMSPGAGNVRGNRQHRDSVALKFGGHADEPSRIASAQAELRSHGREASRDGEADAPACAGDQSDFRFQQSVFGHEWPPSGDTRAGIHHPITQE